MIYLLIAQGLGSDDKPEVLCYFHSLRIGKRVAKDLNNSAAGFSQKYKIEPVKAWF